MSKLILHIFDYFHGHRRRLFLTMLGSVVVIVVLLFHIRFNENISDFLPFDLRDREAMEVYQQRSGANKIVVLIGGEKGQSSPDNLVAATDELTEALIDHGVPAALIQNQVDFDAASQVSDFVYRNIPYFLTEADYVRMEKALSVPGFASTQLSKDKQLLLLPTGGLVTENIGKDPFQLFSPVVERLTKQSADAHYEVYDGYIMTPDLRHSVTVITSPYGSSETAHNRQLITRIEQARQNVVAHHPQLNVLITGGPVIAQGNARQIKVDSAVSVTIAVVLIMVLLFLTLRSPRNILLIVVSIAWGWMFAIAALSLVHATVSIIVIGISSVIIGIAINYPLHLIAHLAHTPDLRRALREILMPLLIGNITTIGAFLTLVPLESVALRDLGLFAAFLLLGTIFFVLVFLPHLVKSTAPHVAVMSPTGSNRRWRPFRVNKGIMVGAVALLTIPLAVLSTRCRFDTDLTHINYMSPEQQSAMGTLATMSGDRQADRYKTIYFLSSGSNLDEACKAQQQVSHQLQSIAESSICRDYVSTDPFLTTTEEQTKRLRRWQAFVDRYGKQLTDILAKEGKTQGFDEQAFADFTHLLHASFSPHGSHYFAPLWKGPRSVLGNDVVTDSKERCHLIAQFKVPENRVRDLQQQLRHLDDLKHYSFEIGQLNSVMAVNLNNAFNYIGWACGFIVFFFLWFAMGNIELAALSFLPMAVSWVWILGIMGLLHIDFNIVNVILATFIFGQGDDYTIFMTEGCQYEYAYGRRLLASYKRSILLSALIMFIGMGTLIIARHPALHSLAEVTIVGMSSVVVMAWLLPPFLFHWLVSRHGALRQRPLTLRSLLMPHRYPQQCATGQPVTSYVAYVRDVYYYCGSDIVSTVRRATANHQAADAFDGCIVVEGGSYGAEALMEALAHPDKTIIARTTDDDDRDVCRRMACRIAHNIQIE